MISQEVSFKAASAGNDTFKAISFHHNFNPPFFFLTVADFPATQCNYIDFSLPFAF